MRLVIKKGIDQETALFLEQKYCCSFTTKAYIINKYKGKEIYTIFINDPYTEVLICVQNRTQLKICNRLSNFPKNILIAIKDELFKAFPNAEYIEIEDSYNPLSGDICSPSLTDVNIHLPTSVEDYNKILGAKSRRHYKYYLKKIQKDYSDVEIYINKVYVPEDIQLLKELFKLKEIRSKNLHEPNLIDLNELSTMCESYGRLSYVMVNGHCAGILVFYKVNKEYYFIQTAFNDDYKNYSLGRTILYESILRSIEEGAENFHFLWGGAEYKNHYAGEELALYTTAVFRKKRWTYLKFLLKVRYTNFIKGFKTSRFGKVIKPIYKRLRY